MTINSTTLCGITARLTITGRDDEGFFLNSDDWDPLMMDLLADEFDLSLTDEHREIILFIRDHYERNECVPQARILLKHLRTQWDESKATRKYLYQLFPYGYGQQACKIAGMRKPLKLMLDV